VLARALEGLGHQVVIETPRLHMPVYTLERLLFNRTLRSASDFDVTVGFDMDGYRIADVASLKGVIADEVRFESGLTRLTMGWQARCERLHVERARRVLCTSRYSAGRAQEFYGLEQPPCIVPELIDLRQWRRALAACPADSAAFTLLFVGRFYRRKRLDVLLDAAAKLRARIPDLKLRIVGGGPCRSKLHALARGLNLEDTVAWLGDVSRAELARKWVPLTRAVGPTGAVWVAWPKKASGVPTDMTEHAVRDVVLPTGWVDTKVCAIDDTWSGLKCVLRLERRPS